MAKKGRSKYTFPVKCEVRILNELVQGFLQAQGFSYVDENGSQYYRGGSRMDGFRFFRYGLSGGDLVIEAWLKNMLGVDLLVEQDSMNSAAAEYLQVLGLLFKEIEHLNAEAVAEEERAKQAEQTAQAEVAEQVATTPEQAVSAEQLQAYAEARAEQLERAQQIKQQQKEEAEKGTALAQAIKKFKPVEKKIEKDRNQFAEKFKQNTEKWQAIVCEVGFWLSIAEMVAAFCGWTFSLVVCFYDLISGFLALSLGRRAKGIVTLVLTVAAAFILTIHLLIA